MKLFINQTACYFSAPKIEYIFKEIEWMAPLTVVCIVHVICHLIGKRDCIGSGYEIEYLIFKVQGRPNCECPLRYCKALEICRPVIQASTTRKSDIRVCSGHSLLLLSWTLIRKHQRFVDGPYHLSDVARYKLEQLSEF